MSNLKVEGMEELLNQISKVDSNIDVKIDNVLIQSGNNVKKEMQNLVSASNINQKHIRDDIKISKVNGKGSNKYVEVAPGKDTNWRAKFLEFGTVNMSAKPFMEPAHLNTKKENIEIIKKGLMEALKI